MLSIIDIILISLGASAVIIYTTLKTIQVVKFKKLVKMYVSQDMTEPQARELAYKQTYNKKKTKDVDVVNQNDDIIDD